MDDWDWVYELIESKPYTPEMSLPEDIHFYFLKKQPLLEDLIERFDLMLEY